MISWTRVQLLFILSWLLASTLWRIACWSKRLYRHSAFALGVRDDKGVGNASNLGLDKTRNVVVLLLRDVQHDGVYVREELSNSRHLESVF